ncbi:MAG: polysaccharide pyruvyl transferase family protein [bacterium]
MNIEIRKVQFVNKGAELMLYAVLDKMKQEYPDARFVMAPGKNSSFEKRGELQLWQKAWLWKYRIQFGDLARFIPKMVREQYGIILDREIDVVLDAAGFAYSDQFSGKSCSELARSSKRWQKNKTKIILLPQALGPFESKKNKKDVKTIANNVDLIFPREKESYEYLVKYVGERQNIEIAPDFTNLIKGEIPDYFQQKNNAICIIPNYKMIDKISQRTQEEYIPFLKKCIKFLLNHNQKPFILVHEGKNDHWIAKEITKDENSKVPIFTEDNPLKVKGIIGASKATISSRFHGLVSSLSQGVPAIGTGWSHKYEMLFEDYHFPEGIIDISSKDEIITEKLNMIIDPDSNQKISSVINDRAEKLKLSSEQMWEKVFKLLKE